MQPGKSIYRTLCLMRGGGGVAKKPKKVNHLRAGIHHSYFLNSVLLGPSCVSYKVRDARFSLLTLPVKYL